MRLKGGAVQTIYLGVDFHARQQTICYLTTDTGEVGFHQLQHQDKEEVRAFYSQFEGHVIVGLEASGYSPWFERLLEELGCEVWLGHATEIRRRARGSLVRLDKKRSTRITRTNTNRSFVRHYLASSKHHSLTR